MAASCDERIVGGWLHSYRVLCAQPPGEVCRRRIVSNLKCSRWDEATYSTPPGWRAVLLTLVLLVTTNRVVSVRPHFIERDRSRWTYSCLGLESARVGLRAVVIWGL
jgi:hypothetical protein